MAYRNKEHQKEYAKNWYEKNKDRIIKKSVSNNKKRMLINREYINNLKKRPCVDCGKNFHPAAMDFDHIGTDKHFNIARILNASYGLKTIIKEIEKCELVCSNCHRVRSYNRFKCSVSPTEEAIASKAI